MKSTNSTPLEPASPTMRPERNTGNVSGSNVLRLTIDNEVDALRDRGVPGATRDAHHTDAFPPRGQRFVDDDDDRSGRDSWSLLSLGRRLVRGASACRPERC